jgi:protein TonB
MEDGPSSRRERYRLRILVCLATSLLVLIAAVRLWPTWPEAADGDAVLYAPHGPVDLREVTQTQHARRGSPPPPPPPVPIFEVEDLVEQPPLDLTVELTPAESPSEAPPGPESLRDGEADESSARVPDVGARQLRIPEPNYTKAARREDIRARVDVEVIIAPTGRVAEARILRRVLLSGSEEAPAQRVVSVLGYGLEEAALDAARRTLFRPARAGDEPVKSRKTLTLTFGPGNG